MAEIVVMPKMNLTMEEGVLVEWFKKPGDTVKAEEVLCSVETEKSAVDMESPSSGVLLKIWGVEGERYPVATPIAIIGQPGEDITALILQGEKQLAGSQTPEPIGESLSTASIIGPAVTPAVQPETRLQVKMLPKVRKLVQDLGIDVAQLAAFCGDRKITEDEVNAFQRTSQQSELPSAQDDNGDRRIRMSTMRLTIVANMTESCQKTARLTNVTEVDMTRAMEKLNERKDEKLSLSALVVKACALAIKEHGIINTVVGKDELIYKAGIHIGVAVDIPDGLVVPVIRNADTKDLHALSREIAIFAAKAQQGELTQADLTGGTFTVTNVGMLGIDTFTPIINYPQTAIMGVGTVKRLPRFLNDSSDLVVSRFIMNLCLSYDHRVIDGAPAARFSLRVRELLQSPDMLFA